MKRASKPLALLLAAGLLSGCAAVAVPAVVGGVIARKAVRGGRTAPRATPTPIATPVATAPARARPAGTPPATPGDTPPPRPAPTPTPVRNTPVDPPRPASASVPEARAAEPATPASQPAPAPAAVGTAGWAEVVRFVAGHRAAERGVLFAPGETRPGPCGNKPAAVLAPLSLALTGPSRGVGADERLWLDALNTIDVTTVFVARDAAEAGAARAAFAKAKLPEPVQGQTLLVGTSLAGVRASVSGRYCVLAIAGRRGDDFPGGLLPDTTPPALASLWGKGWFLFAPPAR